MSVRRRSSEAWVSVMPSSRKSWTVAYTYLASWDIAQLPLRKGVGGMSSKRAARLGDEIPLAPFFKGECCSGFPGECCSGFPEEYA